MCANASWKVHGPRSNGSVRCECQSIQQYVSRNFSLTRYHERWIKVTVNSGNAARGTSEEISIHAERCSSTTPARLHRSVLFMRFNVSTARTDGASREHQAGTYTRRCISISNAGPALHVIYTPTCPCYIVLD